jgi:hypothetical protein
MPIITLRSGDASPADIRLYSVADDTVKTVQSVPIFLYPGESTTKSLSGEPGLRLRTGEASPTDIRLYESADTRKSYQVTDIILSDPGSTRQVVSLPSGEFFGLLKYWNGSIWIKKPLKVFLGGTWQTKPLRRWNGNDWKLIDA